jgi:hypothetical protein
VLTHIGKTEPTENGPHQNVFGLLGCKSTLSASNTLLIYNAIIKPIWTCAVPLTLGYHFHFQHRNPGMLAIESFSHDSGCTLVQQLRKNSGTTALNTVLTSAHTPNDLALNLMVQPNNRRLLRFLPTRFLM